MSASGTCALGGIGTWPQTPWPPFFTFSTSLASAPLILARTWRPRPYRTDRPASCPRRGRRSSCASWRALLRLRAARRARRQRRRRKTATCFHVFSLQAAFNCTKSLIGGRHITPRHSHPLTGPAARRLVERRRQPADCVRQGEAPACRAGTRERARRASARAPPPRPRSISERSAAGFAPRARSPWRHNPPGWSRIAG